VSISIRIAKQACLCAGLLLMSACSTLPGNPVDRSGPGSSGSGDYENRIGRHFYAGTGLGLSRLEPDVSELNNVGVNDRVNAGGQITLGMDLSRQLALELHSADLGSAGLSGGAGRINYHLHGASALFYAGKNRHNYRRAGLSGYGRLGVGLLDNSAVGPVQFVQDNGTHILFGAGLEYMTKIGLGLRAEGIVYEEDVSYGQLAMVYRTGARRTRKPVQIVKAPAPAPVVVPAIKIAEPAAAEPVDERDVCAEFNGVLDGVRFHSNSAKMTAASEVVLDKAAAKLSECKSIPLLIVAHTDSWGKKGYNQSLSEERAQCVVDVLVERGINLDRMSTEAHGETQPVDTNKTSDGRSNNRRVEIFIQ